MLIVKKFGGSSVANKERIFNVAKRCIEDYRAGHDVVVVLSAMGDTTCLYTHLRAHEPDSYLVCRLLLEKKKKKKKEKPEKEDENKAVRKYVWVHKEATVREKAKLGAR